MHTPRPEKSFRLPGPWTLLERLNAPAKALGWALFSLVCWLAYAGLMPESSRMARLVAVLPSLAAAILGGWRAGLAASAFGIAVSLALEWALAWPGRATPLGYVLHVSLTVLLGWLRDLQTALTRQLEITGRMARRAREHNEHLDRLVETRTAQLRESLGDLQTQLARADRTGQSLQQALQTLDNFSRLLPETFFQADLTGRLTMVNDPGLERFGYRMEDLKKGLYVLDMVTPEQREVALENWRRMLAGEKMGQVEFIARCGNGQTFPAILNTALVEGNGQALGVVGVVVDLSERKAVEKALREAHHMMEERVEQRTIELNMANQALQEENRERRLAEEEAHRQKDRAQLYLDLASTILVALDRQGEVVMINRRGLELLGRPEQDVVGRPWFETFLEPGQVAAERARFDQTMAKNAGPVSPHENVVLNSAGEPRRILWRTNLMPDQQGWSAGSLSAGSDVTELRAAQERLEESRLYLRTVLETMNAGVLIIDPESHIIVDANSHVLSMIGLGGHEVLGRPCHLFVCPAQEGACPVTDLGMDLNCDEKVLLAADGRKVPILKSVSRIVSEGREYLLESFIDISRIKELLREQEMDAALAKGILNLVTGTHPRSVELPGGLEISLAAFSLPCHQEGGDHVFAKVLPNGRGGEKTVFSLKDQSGHRVGCLLRSILTDLVHLEILRADPGQPLSRAARQLNRKLGELGLFAADDFVAATLGEVDHDSLILSYLLAGQHSLLVAREGGVIELPQDGEAGRNLALGVFPEVAFHSASFQLRPGDRLVAYSDGIADALAGTHGDGPGPAKTIESLAGEHGNARELLEGLLARAALASGCGITPAGDNESADDITLLGLDLDRQAWQGEEEWRLGQPAEALESRGRFLAEHRERWQSLGWLAPGRLEEALAQALVLLRENGADAVAVKWRYGSHFQLNLVIKNRQAPSNPAEQSQDAESALAGLRLATNWLRLNRQYTNIRLSFDKRPGREQPPPVLWTA